MSDEGAKMPGITFLDKFFETTDRAERRRSWETALSLATTKEQLEFLNRNVPADLKEDPRIIEAHKLAGDSLEAGPPDLGSPLRKWIASVINEWQQTAEKYQPHTPEEATAAVAAISADAITLIGVATGIDLLLGLLPNTEGVVSSNATRHILTSLGVGAVLSAVAHDPVKIGVLRPYQDALEMKFRNRRPDDMALFQAYRTRELCPEEVADARKLTDADMDRIEADNDRIYNTEIAKWGYSEDFALALSRSATRTLTFGNLMALARMGLLDRGTAIYNLWGFGLDRVVMPGALDALEAVNRVSNYEGFRSMIEPSYISGDIEESDLVEYWDRILVPKDLQAWVLPRLRKSREASLAKARGQKMQAQKDLTVSQIQQAYLANLIDAGTARTWLTQVGYDSQETDLLLTLAEISRKSPAGTALKRLPLTDYEKAYKNKLIKLEAVLDRMRGEYLPADIALERALLESGKA